jgi:hypothetical protein
VIAVIQCAATKRPEAGFFRKKDGTPVLFVADPAAARQTTSCTYARPDDPSDRVGSWREALLQ